MNLDDIPHDLVPPIVGRIMDALARAVMEAPPEKQLMLIAALSWFEHWMVTVDIQRLLDAN